MIPQPEQTLKTLSTAMKRIADNVMITNPQGIIEYVNPAFERTTGYSNEEAVGKTPRILRSGHHHAEYYHKLWETILAGKVFRATTTNKKKNGEIYYADQTISPVQNDKGEIICFVSVWKDITSLVKAEETLKYEKKKLEQVLGIEASLHKILNLNKLIDFVVQKTCEVLEAEKCSLLFIDHQTKELCIKGYQGIEESQIEGKPLKMGDNLGYLMERYHQMEAQSVLEKIKIEGIVHQSPSFLSVPIELKDHLLGIINVSHKKGKEDGRFNDLDLKILFMIVHQVRIAIENANLYQQLKYLTITDSLTGIYNRRHFTQTLDYEIARAKRYGRSLAFLMIDIDQFKSYNDTFGHMEGDNLIQTITKTINETVRSTDIVCRYGGDEFAVILPETNVQQARVIAEKIQKSVSELSLKRLMSVSIGMSESHPHTTKYDIIGQADSHLYLAKQEKYNFLKKR